jgi:hypothetical protein
MSGYLGLEKACGERVGNDCGVGPEMKQSMIYIVWL